MSERTEIEDGWYDMHLVRSENDSGESVWFVWDRNANDKSFLKGRMQIDDEEYKGIIRSTNLYLTDPAWPITQEALFKFGWSGGNLLEIDREDLSTPVRGLIKARFFEGNDGPVRWEEVKTISAGGGKIKTRNAMSKNDKRGFVARLMSSVQRFPLSDGNTQNVPGPDDDLPF